MTMSHLFLSEIRHITRRKTSSNFPYTQYWLVPIQTSQPRLQPSWPADSTPTRHAPWTCNLSKSISSTQVEEVHIPPVPSGESPSSFLSIQFVPFFLLRHDPWQRHYQHCNETKTMKIGTRLYHCTNVGYRLWSREFKRHFKPLIHP